MHPLICLFTPPSNRSYHLNSIQLDAAMWQSPPFKSGQPYVGMWHESLQTHMHQLNTATSSSPPFHTWNPNPNFSNHNHPPPLAAAVHRQSTISCTPPCQKSRTIHASTPVTATTILFASCQKPASVHVGTAKNVATAASHQRFAVHKSEPAMQTTTLATIAEATRHRSFLLPLYAITAPICIWTSRCHNCISAPVRAAKSPEYSSSRSHHHRTYSSPLQQIHHLLASFAPAASIAAASSFTLQ